MPIEIVPVQSFAQREQFFTLLREYEASLPARLRHGSVDERELAKLATPPNRALVALRDGAAFGCIVLAHLDERTTVIQRLYVVNAARGSGAGRALMEHAIAVARASGYARVCLDTDAKELRAAYQLYLSLGFRPCEPFTSVPYDGADFMELLL